MLVPPHEASEVVGVVGVLIGVLVGDVSPPAPEEDDPEEDDPTSH